MIALIRQTPLLVMLIISHYHIGVSEYNYFSVVTVSSVSYDSLRKDFELHYLLCNLRVSELTFFQNYNMPVVKLKVLVGKGLTPQLTELGKRVIERPGAAEAISEFDKLPVERFELKCFSYPLSDYYFLSKGKYSATATLLLETPTNSKLLPFPDSSFAQGE